MSIRLVLVDDHSVVRQGLKMFLSLDPELEVVGKPATEKKPSRLWVESCPTWC